MFIKYCQYWAEEALHELYCVKEIREIGHETTVVFLEENQLSQNNWLVDLKLLLKEFKTSSNLIGDCQCPDFMV